MMLGILTNKNAKVTVLGGNGSASFQDGKLSVMVPETLQYLFLKISSK